MQIITEKSKILVNSENGTKAHIKMNDQNLEEVDNFT